MLYAGTLPMQDTTVSGGHLIYGGLVSASTVNVNVQVCLCSFASSRPLPLISSHSVMVRLIVWLSLLQVLNTLSSVTLNLIAPHEVIPIRILYGAAFKLLSVAG